MLRAVVMVTVLLLVLVPGTPAALPQPSSPAVEASYATPDWMTSDIVTQLSIIGGPVLAPSYIPGGFGFLPSVDAYPGYYSFYWLIPGAPPTYLQVTGTVGGSIPDYSLYDRNVQLVQNETVLGYPAWHDLTPIYDLVYFAIDGVVYTVEANNIGESSVGIANSLTYVDVPIVEPEAPTEEPVEEPVEEPTDIPTEVPVDPGFEEGVADEAPVDETAETEPEATEETVDATEPGDPAIFAPESVVSGESIIVEVAGVTAADLGASSGEFTLTGDSTVEGAEPSTFGWIAPVTENGRTVTFTLKDPASGDTLATAKTRVEPIPDDQIPVVAESLSCPTQIPMGSMGGIAIKGSGQLIIDASDGYFPDLGPNPAFSSNGEVDESDVMQGVIRKNKNIWVFWQPETAPEPYTAYLFVQDWSGNTLLECGVEVVFPEDAPTYPDMGAQDGSGIVAGLGFAANADVAEGTSVNSPDMPPLGQNGDGSAVALESIPFSDGTTTSTTSSTNVNAATSDGTSIEAPAASTPAP